MIKAIIFDLGGVLVPEKGAKIKKEISNYIDLSDRKFHLFLKQNHEKLMTGRITLLSLYAELERKFNIKIKPSKILQKHLALYIRYSTKRNKNIIKLIKNLKKNYRVVALTNTEKEIAEYNRKKGLFRLFDKTFISTDIHLMKPQTAIFRKVLKDINCRPREVIFIDDKIDHVSHAQKLGLNSMLFENLNKLKKNLVSLRVIFRDD